MYEIIKSRTTTDDSAPETLEEVTSTQNGFKRLLDVMVDADQFAAIIAALGGSVGETKMILGQENPGSVNTIIYQLPAGKNATLDDMEISNTGGGTETFRIFIDPSDSETFDATTAIAYDIPIAAGVAIQHSAKSLGLTVEDSAVAVWASSTNVTFTLAGTVSDA